jgi:limonene-1,2-epoxide hydrolase
MENKILAFMEDMASNDAKKVGQWFTENSSVWIPPANPVSGISRITALFRALFGRYESVQWKILEIIPINEVRCIHVCQSRGHLKGSDVYTNQVITDITFDENGKILTLSDYFKDTTCFSKAHAQPASVNSQV